MGCECFRALHVGLTMFVGTSLLVLDTRLSRALLDRADAQAFFKALMFYGLFTLCLVLYNMICFMDPGFVRDEINLGSDTRRPAANESSLPVLTLRKCGFCDLVQPLRARHCEECGRCVQKYDHHCPWFGVCIGEKNHKYFLLFLVLKCILVMWTLNVVQDAFKQDPDWSEWCRSNLLLLIDLVILIPVVCSIMCLIAIHSYLTCSNQTTWEMVSRERISYLKTLDLETNPFHEGYVRNAYYFLCNKNVRRWEILYNSRIL